MTDRRVLVYCLVNGQGPVPLVMDTGGVVGLVEEGAAKALGMREVGETSLALHGRRRKHAMHVADTLSLGGVVKQEGALFAATDDVTYHDDAVGALAAGTLTTMDAELDFEASEWRIYPSGGLARSDWSRSAGAFVKQPEVNGSQWMFAPLEIGGGRFPIGLDTGMPAEMRLSGPALDASGLWDTPVWSPGAPNGEGRMVRIPALRLGGIELTDIYASLSRKSLWADFEHGLIGLPILRRLDIATRPQEGTLYLRRNALPDPTPYYNRAGMWLDRDGNNARVKVVGPGSPADMLGIKAGDRLLSVDFDGLVEAMHGPAGTRIPLTVKSGKRERALELVLADFL